MPSSTPAPDPHEHRLTPPGAVVHSRREASVDGILARLAVSRGRRIHVVPMDFGTLPVEGTWVHARGGDVIFYDQHADSENRDRIVRGQLDSLLRDPVELIDDDRPTTRELIEEVITSRPSPVLAELILGPTFVAPVPSRCRPRATSCLPAQGTPPR